MDRLEDDCRQLRQKSIPETEATTAVQPTMTREEALIRANNGSEIDKELYQKISQVWGSKNGSYAHKKALRELIISGQTVLAKSFNFNRKWKNYAQDAEIVYSRDVERDVLIYLSLHIDEFFPKETSILTSLKQWLERNAINKGIDDFRKQQRRDLQPGSIDRDIVVSESGDRVKTEPKDDRPHGLEAIFAGLDGKCAEKIKEYVEKDPEGKLKACAMRHPHENCNCYTLVQMRFFSQPPLSETGAAEAIGVNKNSLHYHWNRQCLPLLKEIVREIAANLGHEFG